MLPRKKTYSIPMRDDSIELTCMSDRPNRFRIHTGYSDESITLPWMEKEKLIAWLRKAADEIEGANFE